MCILIRAGLRLARTNLPCLFILLVPAAALAGALAWREARSVTGLVEHLEAWLDRNTELPSRDVPAKVRLVSEA